jgi:hypothetical protein
LVLLPFAALMLFGMYRRYRSHVGPQEVMPRRMLLRVLLLSGFGIYLLSLLPDLNADLAMSAGLAAGAGLGWLSLSHTRFETRQERHYYIPNIYIGLALSSLLALRIVWRFLSFSQGSVPGAMGGGALGGPPANPLAMLGGPKSLLTVVPLGVVIGYYVLYYIGVLLLSRRAVAAAQPAVQAVAQGDQPG